MKLLKILLGKPLLVFLALLVQALILSFVLIYFSTYFLLFQILNTVLGLILFLHLLSKREPPEFKIPWLLIVLTLPVFGMLLYVCLSPHRASKRQIRRFEHLLQQKKMLLPPERDALSAEKALGTLAGVDRYLTGFHSYGHTGNRVKYFPCGEKFYADLLTELSAAKRFIFMEYFLIEPGEMWEGIHRILLEKVKAGVEVRILYDDVGNLGKTSGGFYKKLRREGFQCYKFNPIRPILSGIHNNRDHRKITVIDGRVAYTGGINIGDEYINKRSPFGHWKDTAIKIEGSAVLEFTYFFLQFFDGCSGKSSDLAAYLPTEVPHFSNDGVVHPFADGPHPFYKEKIAENTFLQMIGLAQRTLYITTPYLVIDHNLTAALCNAAARGVDVRIITPHVPDKKLIFQVTRSHYKPLLEAGVRIFEYTPGFIHAKTLLCDGHTAFVGTVNMDYRSLVHHFECGALLFGTDCVADIQSDLIQTLDACTEVTLDGFRQNWLAALFCSLLAAFFPLL